jgi:hypothetical protein
MTTLRLTSRLRPSPSLTKNDSLKIGVEVLTHCHRPEGFTGRAHDFTVTSSDNEAARWRIKAGLFYSLAAFSETPSKRTESPGRKPWRRDSPPLISRT